MPLAYPIGRHDEALARFINTWIGRKRKDASIDAAYNYWILGRDRGRSAAALVDSSQRDALGGVTAASPQPCRTSS